MKQLTIICNQQHGIHMRVASDIINLSQACSEPLQLRNPSGRFGNSNSITDLLLLCVKQKEELTLFYPEQYQVTAQSIKQYLEN